MTEHYNRLDQAEMSAHVDALTGLWDREQYSGSAQQEEARNSGEAIGGCLRWQIPRNNIKDNGGEIKNFLTLSH